MLTINLLGGAALPESLIRELAVKRNIMFDGRTALTDDEERLLLGHTRTVEGARNLVTLGQFVRLMPVHDHRRSALLAYLYDPSRPSGYTCDQRYGIDTQYTKRAADLLVRKVQQAQELVNA